MESRLLGLHHVPHNQIDLLRKVVLKFKGKERCQLTRLHWLQPFLPEFTRRPHFQLLNFPWLHQSTKKDHLQQSSTPESTTAPFIWCGDWFCGYLFHADLFDHLGGGEPILPWELDPDESSDHDSPRFFLQNQVLRRLVHQSSCCQSFGAQWKFRRELWQG